MAGPEVFQAGLAISASKVGTGLEQIAVVIADAPVQKLVINLLDNGIEPPRLTIESDFGKIGSWGQDTRFLADIEKYFFANECGVFESIAKIQLFQTVIRLAWDELIEINFE